MECQEDKNGELVSTSSQGHNAAKDARDIFAVYGATEWYEIRQNTQIDNAKLYIEQMCRLKDTIQPKRPDLW